MDVHLNWFGIASTILAGLALFWIQRQAVASDRERDKMDSRMKEVEGRIHTMEMKVIGEIPSREDYQDLNRRVEAVASTLHEVRDIVLRMEAVAKAK